MTLLDNLFWAERNCHIYLSELPLHPSAAVEPYMALFEPLCALELIDSLENGLSTNSVSTMRVSKVTCKIDLMRLNLTEKLRNDVDICLCALALLDTSCLIERKVKEVAVCSVIETE